MSGVLETGVRRAVEPTSEQARPEQELSALRSLYRSVERTGHDTVQTQIALGRIDERVQGADGGAPFTKQQAAELKAEVVRNRHEAMLTFLLDRGEGISLTDFKKYGATFPAGCVAVVEIVGGTEKIRRNLGYKELQRDAEYGAVYLRFVPQQQLAEAQMLCNLDAPTKEALGLYRREYQVEPGGKGGTGLRRECRQFKVCQSADDLPRLRESFNVRRETRG